MTDLQIKYWQAREQARANAAQEALKAQEIAVKEREASAKEQDTASQIAYRATQSGVNEVQARKLGQEICNLEEEAKLTAARTDLTVQEKNNAILDRVTGIIGAVQQVYDLVTSPAKLATQIFGSIKGSSIMPNSSFSTTTRIGKMTSPVEAFSGLFNRKRASTSSVGALISNSQNNSRRV